MKFIKKNYFKILFITILLIAILVRVYQWPDLLELNVDESMTALNAKAIAETGKDLTGVSFPVYLEAWGFAGQSVMLAYIMAFFIKIFGFSLFSIRLPMILISLISLFIFYDFAKRIFKSKKVALVAFAFLAISPWHILQSKWSIDCNMFPHFALISIYLLYRGITDKKIFLYLSMIFFGLTMYTYGIAIYFVPFFLLISAIYLFINKKVTLKDLIICILIYFVTFTPLLIMYIINFFKINESINLGIFTIKYFPNSTRTDDMLLFSNNIIFQLLENLKTLFNIIFKQYDYLEWNATNIFGTTYHISIIFIFIGIIYYFIKKEKNIGIKLFILWTFLSLFVGVFINGTNINRLNIIWYPLLFLTVYGLYLIYKKIKYKRVFMVLISFIYIILFVSYNVFFYNSYYDEINHSGCFSNGLKEGILFVKNIDKEKYYLNFNNDGGFKIYIDTYNAVLNTDIKEIKDIKNLDKESIYIVQKENIDKVDISEFKFYIYGNYYIVMN